MAGRHSQKRQRGDLVTYQVVVRQRDMVVYRQHLICHRQ